jgi:membrane-bound lytic murein transglycosylase A
MTTAGMEVSAERTIATDNNFYPKGALAFLDIADPLTQERKPRLVFDQDTGGAIKGGGHIDLYFGSGEEAYQKAGIMKQIGRLYYLVPKNL